MPFDRQPAAIKTTEKISIVQYSIFSPIIEPTICKKRKFFGDNPTIL